MNSTSRIIGPVNQHKAINVSWILLGTGGVCYESYRMWQTAEAFGSFYGSLPLPYMPFIVVSILAIVAGIGGLARKNWAKYLLGLVSASGLVYSVIVILLFLFSLPTIKWEYFHFRPIYVVVLFLLAFSLATIVSLRRKSE